MEPTAKDALALFEKAFAEPTESKNIPVSNPLGIGSVYANDFGLGFTLTDVRLIFNEIGADVASNTPSKILKANVVIPLQGAESLAKQMLVAVEQHKAAVEQYTKKLQAHAKPPAKA